MTKLTHTLALCLFFIYGTAFAVADDFGIEDQVVQLWQNLSEQDQQAFEAMCSDDWALFTGRGKRNSAEQLFSMHRERITNFKLKATHMDVERIGKVALVTYDANMQAEVNGKPWQADFVMTNIFVFDGERWVCRHMHESRKDS